jgi:hypothetical protein
MIKKAKTSPYMIAYLPFPKLKYYKKKINGIVTNVRILCLLRSRSKFINLIKF